MHSDSKQDAQLIECSVLQGAVTDLLLRLFHVDSLLSFRDALRMSKQGNEKKGTNIIKVCVPSANRG